jgi:5-formyltetrahydrofolate cyclo-ligase
MKSVRRQCLGELQYLIDTDEQWRSEAFSRLTLQAGQRIGLTWPLSGEPDLRSCLCATGVPLALPAALDGQLVYRPWKHGDHLVNDDCGIPAPVAVGAPLQPEQLALLLVPALAVDRRGVRLGYGGGWYDRLRADPAWRRVPALVVLPSACVCDLLPDDPWDVPVDGWLDEQGCHGIAAGADRI